jgi:ubiquinone/menaquinone biosynthesis C-methylase UbiE
MTVSQSHNKSFSSVTEAPGQQATVEQLSMLVTRYQLASRYAKDRDVLELACGTGTGLGYLAATAKSVVGGDIDPDNVKIALKSYQENSKISVLELDACRLPFADNSFDTVLFFEAIYYIDDIQKCLNEVRRVTRQNGILIIVSVNREWVGFNASPFSHQYFNGDELERLLQENGFSSQVFLGFYDDNTSLLSRLTRSIRRTAVKLNLIPKTMDAKKFLKRLFYGKLNSIPTTVHDDLAAARSLQEMDGVEPTNRQNYKVIYVVGKKD